MIDIKDLRVGNHIQLHEVDAGEDRKATFDWLKSNQLKRI